MFLKKVFPKLALATTAMAMLVPQSAAYAAIHTDRQVSLMQTSSSYPGCVFFQLDGVAVADPNVSSSAWFGVRKDHPLYSEMFALLVTVRESRRVVDVHTGGSVCGGLASAEVIFFK